MRVRWLAIFLAAAAAMAQTAPEPASVSCTVTNSVTGEPILRAHVMVYCMPQDPQHEQHAYGALTNEKGAFSIGPIPPSQCNMTAERVGFVPLPRTFSNFPLTGGVEKSGVKLALIPTGSITGRVVNAAGEPVEGVGIYAFSGNLTNTSNATTNDKGEFRVGGLPPGKYSVRATPRNWSQSIPPEVRTDGTVERHDTATYFPDSTDEKNAQRIELKAGAEVSGIEIKLARTPIVKVSGQVTGIPPGMKMMVVAGPTNLAGQVYPDGTFALWRLDPGKYTLRAQQEGTPTPLLSAPLDIEVTTANLEHLELRFIPPFDIVGQLRFDDEQARKPPRPEPLRVYLDPVGPLFAPQSTGDVETDDSFKLVGAEPGRYRVVVTGTSGYVKSVRAGETEVEGDILDLSSGSPGPVTITLSSQFCQISGTVNDSLGQPSDADVVLFPMDGHANQSHQSNGGSYGFRVRPGIYKLVAVDDGRSIWGLKGADLDDIQPETVEVSAGDKAVKDLVKRQ